jgi:hypothetical protein
MEAKMTTEPRWPIGTKYKRVGKHNPDVRTVIDVLRTFNSAGDLVEVQYRGEYQWYEDPEGSYKEVVDELTVTKGVIRLLQEEVAK